MSDILQELDSEQAPAPPGHNQPPEPTPIDRANDLVGNANRWIAERPRIEDADQMGKAEGFIIQLRECSTATYQSMRSEKKPHEDAIAAIGKQYEDPLAKLKIALDAMNFKKTEWLQWNQQLNDADKMNERFDADLARKKAEAAAAAAAAPTASVEAQLEAQRAQKEAAAIEKQAAKPVERAQVSSEFSSKRSGLRTYWHARLKPAATDKERTANEKEVLSFFAKDPEGRAAMVTACLKVADARAKVAKKVEAAPPGVEFYSDTKA